MADYDDYRDAPADRFAGFYDPDEAAPTAGPYSAFPRYPGLLEAAQRPFRAAGLNMPWYISRGNHDGLVQGFTGKRFDHVLLILLDGLGFDIWTGPAAGVPFFERLSRRGDVTSLTAVFPSTTSASLTTLATGHTPREHGLLEWNLYLPEVDDVIATLPFKRWHQRSNDALVRLFRSAAASRSPPCGGCLRCWSLPARAWVTDDIAGRGGWFGRYRRGDRLAR